MIVDERVNETSLLLSLSIKGINLYRNCQPLFTNVLVETTIFKYFFRHSYFLHPRRPCFQYPCPTFSFRQPHKVPLNLPLNAVFLHGKARRRTRYGVTPRSFPHSLRRATCLPRWNATVWSSCLVNTTRCESDLVRRKDRRNVTYPLSKLLHYARRKFVRKLLRFLQANNHRRNAPRSVEYAARTEQNFEQCVVSQLIRRQTGW